MERKHKTYISKQRAGSLAKTASTPRPLMEGPQQGRATKLLNMSRQQLSVVIGLLTGHLGLHHHLHKLERT
jgi:hypothetical protein